MTEASEPEFHLYRWYDEEGWLLYVGMTRNLRQRTKSHWQNSWWTRWAAVIDVDLGESGTKRQVAERELAAIINERPLFNSLASPGARWRAANYLLEQGVDPAEHVHQLPAHARTRDDVVNVGETARRAQPILNEERLAPGEVNPAWPAPPLTRDPAAAPVKAKTENAKPAEARRREPDLAELTDRYWDMWAAYGRGEGDLPPRWLHERLVNADAVYGFRLIKRDDGRETWAGPNPVHPHFDDEDARALHRHTLIMENEPRPRPLPTIANEFATYSQLEGEPPLPEGCITQQNPCGRCALCWDWTCWRQHLAGKEVRWTGPEHTTGCTGDDMYGDSCGECRGCYTSRQASRRVLHSRDVAA